MASTLRIWASEDGESHLEDVDLAFEESDFLPPAPPMHLTAQTPASDCFIARVPAEWHADWHPAPVRELAVYLTGEGENRGERWHGSGTSTGDDPSRRRHNGERSYNPSDRHRGDAGRDRHNPRRSHTHITAVRGGSPQSQEPQLDQPHGRVHLGRGDYRDVGAPGGRRVA